MSEMDPYYRVLGLEPGVTEQEVMQAYMDSFAVWNPDRFAGEPDLQEKAREKLREINEASDRLLTYLAGSPGERSEAEQEQPVGEKPGDSDRPLTLPAESLAPSHHEAAGISSIKSKARSALFAEVPKGVSVLVCLSLVAMAAIIGWRIYTLIPPTPSGQGKSTAVRFNPSSASFLVNGVAHFQQGQLDRAIEDYTKDTLYLQNHTLNVPSKLSD